MQHSKEIYCWGIRRGKKRQPHRKLEGKRKWWVLAQSSYSLQVNRRQSPREEIVDKDHPMKRITQEVLSKAGRTGETTVAF